MQSNKMIPFKIMEPDRFQYVLDKYGTTGPQCIDDHPDVKCGMYYSGYTADAQTWVKKLQGTYVRIPTFMLRLGLTYLFCLNSHEND